MRITPLTLRKKLALELWRMREQLMRQEHPLRQLFWECTLRCNLHCLHCGSDRITLWDHHTCPRCQGEMKATEKIEFWT